MLVLRGLFVFLVEEKGSVRFYAIIAVVDDRILYAILRHPQSLQHAADSVYDNSTNSTKNDEREQESNSFNELILYYANLSFNTLQKYA
jgi:hypothetical protein